MAGEKRKSLSRTTPPSYGRINYCLVPPASVFAPTITILFSPSSLLVGPWPVGSRLLSALDRAEITGVCPGLPHFLPLLVLIVRRRAPRPIYEQHTMLLPSGVIAFPVRQRSVSFAPEPLFFAVGHAPIVFVGIFAKSLVCARMFLCSREARRS